MSAGSENKAYDCWVHWLISMRCNLDCVYCFTNDQRKTAELKPIDIPALLQTLECHQKTFRISFTGIGEPFLIPNLVEACVALTQKHYVSFNTNLTSGKIRQLADRVDPKKVISIHASAHLRELERTGLTETFIKHYRLLQEKGFTIWATAVAYPDLVADAQKYVEAFKEQGVRLGYGPFMGQYNSKNYPQDYTQPELAAFGMNTREAQTIFTNQSKLCNAGYNLCVADDKGDLKRCFSIHDPMGNIYREINYFDDLYECPLPTCGCPFKHYDPNFFKKSLEKHALKKEATARATAAVATGEAMGAVQPKASPPTPSQKPEANPVQKLTLASRILKLIRGPRE